jgi:hypothetical protein
MKFQGICKRRKQQHMGCVMHGIGSTGGASSTGLKEPPLKTPKALHR